MAVPHFPTLFANVIMEEVTRPREVTGLVGGSSMKPKADICLKQLQFMTIKTPKGKSSPSLGLAFILFRGTVLDELVKKLAAKLQLPMESDVFASVPELGLGGTLDFLLHLPEEDGGLTVVELKSINPEQFLWLKEPLPAHKYQTAVYALAVGAKQSLLYYIPHQDNPATDPVTMLKRAVRGASGVLQEEIETLVNKYGHLSATAPEVKELGRQFLLVHDQKTFDEIRETMLSVLDGNERGEWLGKNTKQCQLCAFSSPCYANETFQACDKRAAP